MMPIVRSYLMNIEALDSDRLCAFLRASDAPWHGARVTVSNQTLDPTLHRTLLTADGSGTEVSLVDDNVAESQYVLIEGDEGQTWDVEAALRRAVPVFSPAEIRDDTAHRYRERPSTLIRLALASGAQLDAVSANMIITAMYDDSPDVRRAAIEAAGLTQWPQMREPLRERASNDEDPDVRLFADRVRASLDQTLGGNDDAE